MGLNKTIFYTILSQISIQFLGILSGIFIARLIGPEGKGVFAIYQANAQLLITFFSLSMGNVLTYFIPSGKIKPDKMMGISLLITLIGSICVLIIILLFNYTRFKGYLFPTKYSSYLYIIWIFLFSILSIFNVIATGFFQGLKLFGVVNKILVINSIFNFIFFGIVFFLNFYKYYEIDVLILLYGLLIVTFINTVQFIIPYIKHVKIKPSFNISFKNDIKPIFKYSFYTHLGIFVGFFNSRFSLWVLNYYLNEVAIGLFSLAINLIVIFNLISAPIGNVLMPYLSSEENKDKNEMFYKYSKINFTLLLTIGIIGFFISVPFIPLLYGDGFKYSALLFQILIPGIIFASLGRLLSVFIAANNKQEYNLYATIIGFIVNIILNYILIKFYGLIGASIAGSLTYILTCLSMMYFVHCKLNLPFGNYFLMNFNEIKRHSKLGLNFILKKQ